VKSAWIGVDENRMKKKFKIIDASTGEKLKLKEGEILHKWGDE
jgi:hypothetical protein